MRGVSGLYKITNITNGKLYVGSAVDLENRFSTHWASLRYGKHDNSHLQHSWDKYGEASFTFTPLLLCNKEDLLFYEQRAIDVYQVGDSCYGYNLAPTAGSNLGVKYSEKSKKRMSVWQKGRKLTVGQYQRLSKTFFVSGHISYNKGVPVSEETKRKISKTLQGNIPWNKGIPATEEQKARLSEAHKGYVMPQEQKDKIAVGLRKAVGDHHWNIGFHHSEETKRKISAAMKSHFKLNSKRR